MAATFVTPESLDVLCGRGISCHQHPGNKFLRQLIDRNLPKYASADSKSDKSSILRDIIRSILTQGGRFLKKDSETEFYYEAGMKAARDKVGHCLREAMAERYTRTKPILNKIITNLVPKPQLASLTPRNDVVCTAMTITEGHHGVTRNLQVLGGPIELLPSIVSEDDDCSKSSTESKFTEPPSKGVAFTAETEGEDLVDALYELPTQGEWEQLILPRTAFTAQELFVAV